MGHPRYDCHLNQNYHFERAERVEKSSISEYIMAAKPYKLLYALRNKPLNPMILLVFCALVGLATLFFIDDANQGMDFFLAFLGAGISMALLQSALIQNAIQKDNIKLQLFDKRYQVLEAILDSITLVRRDNWDRYMMFGTENDPNFVNRQIFDTEERLYKAAQLSVSIFDTGLIAKIEKVNNAYCAVARSYKKMLVINLHSMEDLSMRDQFMTIVSKHFISPGELDYEKMNAELRDKLPELYLPLLEFSQECDKYVNLIKDLKVLGDFNKYVIIRDLDS